MRQGRWVFNRARKVYEPTIREEHVVKEITDRLWYQARIKAWRVRERLFNAEKFKRTGRWQQLSTPGIPDLIAWIPAREQSLAIPLFIEVKRPKGIHRASQERFIDEARAGGCCAFFAESWSDVVRELRPFGVDVKEISSGQHL